MRPLDADSPVYRCYTGRVKAGPVSFTDFTEDLMNRTRNARRISAVLLAAVAALLVSLVNPQPARADVGAWGNIENNLPAAYPVKIADFGVGGNHYCQTINAGSLTCNEWWLPSGMSDSDLKGYWFDTDGFQVENVSQYYVSSYGWVPGDVWFRIHDYHEVNCYMSGTVPYCHVYVI